MTTHGTPKRAERRTDPRAGGRTDGRADRGTGGRGRAAVVAALAVVALGALAGLPTSAVAQGWIEPLPGVDGWGVVKLETDVTVRVTGRVAEVVVEEWFENRGGALGEGDYLYPLPGEAVFSNFSLYQGEEELRGETMDADRARGIYEEIVRQKRDPALIEMVGHGLVRARIFPIEPGQRRRITLRYTQMLERAGDAVQFRYAAGRRSPGGAVQRRGDVRRVPTGDDVPLTFTLTADTAGFGEPFSPTHALDVERRQGTLRVRPASTLTGDFSVFLPLSGDAVGISLATHRPVGEDGYFMMTLSPGAVERGSTPRDITAVVDVSGSMSGVKLEQTRAALHQLLGSLAPHDRFRLLAFSNRVRASSDGWRPARGADLAEARRWVDDLRADGGTNIAGALEEALRLDSPDDRLPIVVFLTDGLPTVGEQRPERIAADAESRRGRARVFAFGVGFDVNTYLLDRLGVAGRGSTAYVEPGEDVERALATLSSKITHPVLTDLRIDGAPVHLTEIYPEELPDLFAGEELVVFGRYTDDGRGRLRLHGRRGDGEERYSVQTDFPARAPGNDYIPRLWASRKLGELTRQVRLNGPDPELVESIRETALRYGLLSDYTSYLVLEPGMVADGRPTPTPTQGGVRLQSATAQGAPANSAMGPTAPPPSGSGATGEAAVRASRRSQALRAVASAEDLAMAEQEATEEMSRADVKVVAGRTFQLEGAVWTERPDDGKGPDTVTVALYSEAYFALLEALPELKPLVAELSPVSVRGSDVRIVFTEDGVESLRDREIERLVVRFRGR